MKYFYINTETLEYPFYEGDIRLVYPNIEEEFKLPDQGIFARVDKDEIPSIDYESQMLTFNTPVLQDGKWTQSITVLDLSADEIIVRTNMRNSMLNIVNTPE
jgi:hypothetical protein